MIFPCWSSISSPSSPELGKTSSEVSPEAMELLVGYSWPGNVRELQSVLKQALLQATGPVLLPEFLPARTAQAVAAAGLTGGRRPVR